MKLTLPYLFSIFLLPAIILQYGCKKKESPKPLDYTMTINGTTYVINDTIRFHTNAPSGSNLQWDFGDGNVSTESAPKHVYIKSGFFTIKLNINNGAQTITDSLKITSNLDCNMTGRLYVGDSLTFYASGGSPGVTYIWSFDGGDVLYTSAGTITRVYLSDGSKVVSVKTLADNNFEVGKSFKVNLYPSYTHQIARSRSWHHMLDSFTDNTFNIPKIYTFLDTMLPVRYINDGQISIGQDTLAYNSSSMAKSQLYFSGKYGTLTYNYSNDSISYDIRWKVYEVHVEKFYDVRYCKHRYYAP